MKYHRWGWKKLRSTGYAVADETTNSSHHLLLVQDSALQHSIMEWAGIYKTSSHPGQQLTG